MDQRKKDEAAKLAARAAGQAKNAAKNTVRAAEEGVESVVDPISDAAEEAAKTIMRDAKGMSQLTQGVVSIAISGALIFFGVRKIKSGFPRKS